MDQGFSSVVISIYRSLDHLQHVHDGCDDAWIPFLIASLLTLIITRFSNPLDILFHNFSKDLFLLSFGMFDFMPLLVEVFYDEMDRLFSLYLMVIITLLMVGTVIFYMRKSDQRGRNTALSVGLFLTISMAVADPSWYWYMQIEANFWSTVIAGVIVYMILLLPVLVGVFRKTNKKNAYILVIRKLFFGG